MKKQLLVIGGGAAGFFCAVNAARLHPEFEVLIAERSNKLLSKVKVSGGGRCNVTHDCSDIDEMSNCYPRGRHFVKKLFHRFFVPDTIRWFEERGVKLKTEADGRMFPITDSSQTIIDCLLKEAATHHVKILMHTEITSLSKEGNKFKVVMAGGETLFPDIVCIACGGYPRTGMYEWLKALGHHIEEPAPSLFTFNLPKHPLNGLMGISVERASVKITGTKLSEQGPLLITHWGLSGPVVLRLSAWGARILKEHNWDFQVRINWKAEWTEQEWREKMQQIKAGAGPQRVMGKNLFGLPQRLWEFIATEAGVKQEMKWGDLSRELMNRLVSLLYAYECHVKGKTTFKEEFVTAGGIRLSEIDPQTMQSKLVTGLFFAGEITDVDGITGGYNFQNAWSGAFVAAENM